MYGNERTKPVMITTDPVFGTGAFRNVHLLFCTCSQFLWRCLFPTKLCCAFLLMNRAVNSPQDGIYPSWLSRDCWHCINTTLGVTVVQAISHSSPRVLGRAGVERRGSGWPHSFLSAASEPHGCFCSETSAGTCAPVGCLAEVSGLGLYKATQPLCLPNAVQSRSQPGLGFVAGLGACKAKDSGFGLHLSVYLRNDRKSKFLTSKYESKQKHCEGQLSTAERWCYPSHTFNS